MEVILSSPHNLTEDVPPYKRQISCQMGPCGALLGEWPFVELWAGIWPHNHGTVGYCSFLTDSSVARRCRVAPHLESLSSNGRREDSV